MGLLKAVFGDLFGYSAHLISKGWQHKRVVLAIVIILGGSYYFYTNSKDTAVTANVETPLLAVTVENVRAFSAANLVQTVGQVEAVSEANLQTEAGGRVTKVYTTLGSRVSAGSVLASLENSAQQAALLQAEGAYDTAVAGSAQSSVGVDEAKNNLEDKKNSAVTVFKSAYNTTNGIVVSSIDPFFSNPNGFVPGLRINGKGFTAELNAERVAYQTLLPEWQKRVNMISKDSDLETELEYAQENTQRTINFVNTFLTVFSRHSDSNAYSEADLQGFSASFTNLRSTLIGVQASLDGALTGLQSAQEGLKRAELSASGGTTSVADAQVKIALGTLRAAQANYEKTLVRTPISGVVNALYLKAGDYVSPNQPAAIIANNSDLEIKTYLSEDDSAGIAIGDAVDLAGVATGTVASKAAALDPSNGKIAVTIVVDPNQKVVNGSTVRLTFRKQSTESDQASGKIVVPIAALKLTSTGSNVFTVNDDDTLSAVTVTIGAVAGDKVEILSGLTADSAIVTDARGLSVGQKVTVVTN